MDEENTQPQAHQHQFLQYEDGVRCPCGEPKPADAEAEQVEEVQEVVEEQPQVEEAPQEEVAPAENPELESAQVEDQVDPTGAYFETILSDLDRVLVSLKSFREQNPGVSSQNLPIAIGVLDLGRTAIANVALEIAS